MKPLPVIFFARLIIILGIIGILCANSQPYVPTVYAWVVGIFVTYILTYVAEATARKSEVDAPPAPPPAPKPPNEYDVELFQRIECELPRETFMKAVNEFDFRNSYDNDWLTPLWRFYEEWGTREFVDPELETCRVRFWGAVRHFSNLTAQYTGPYGTGRRLSVQQDRVDEMDQPEWVWKRGDEINEAASQMDDHFQLLIRAGREKIPKAPPTVDRWDGNVKSV